MTEHIIELWNEIIGVSYELKHTHKSKFDGLNYWKSFKQNLQGIKGTSRSWNYQTHDELRYLFNNVINKINIDTDKDGKTIEHIHFLRQLLWIPHKDDGKLSFTRLMQIALNYGQLKGLLESYPDEDIKSLIETNLEELSNIYNYVDEDTLDTFDLTTESLNEIVEILEKQKINPSLIPSSTEIIGGNISNKYYIKYIPAFHYKE